MKFKTDTKKLQKTLEHVIPGIPGKTTNPVLENLKLKTTEGILKVSATNMNDYYLAKTEAVGTEDGATLVNGDQFYKLVKACNGENIDCSLESNTLVIKTASAEFRLNTADPKNFPKTPSASGKPEHTLELSGKELKELVRKTAFAVSKDDTRPLFKGIYFDMQKGKMNAVGTNTHRISVYQMTELEPEKPLTGNIPANVLSNIVKNIDEKETAELVFIKNLATIRTKEWEITVHTIEGKFPDYMRIVPKTGSTEFTVDKNSFINAVSRVSLCCSTDSGYEIVKLDIQDKTVTVLSHGSQNTGNAKETIPCEKTGNDLKIAVNAKYLVEFCKAVDGNKVKFTMNNSLNPIKIEEVTNPDFIHIVTPVRVVF